MNRVASQKFSRFCRMSVGAPVADKICRVRYSLRLPEDFFVRSPYLLNLGDLPIYYVAPNRNETD